MKKEHLRSLFVMCPHPNYSDDFFFFKDHVDESMMNVNSSRI